MPIEYDADFIRQHYAKMGKPMPEEVQRAVGKGESLARAEEPTTKRQKYGNRRTEADGRIFDSKHEAERWRELQIRLMAGEILGVIPQVAFRLPGGIIYRADFVILERSGTFRVEDAKSSATA